MTRRGCPSLLDRSLKCGVVKKTVKLYLRFMKITLELLVAIVRKAKILAAERQMTLRELVLQGLEYVLDGKQVSAQDRAKRLFAQMDSLPVFAAADRMNREDTHAR
jgi:hypothetical protein